MPITSLILECRPDAGAAASGLCAIPEVELVERNDPFLVVVTDTLSRAADKGVYEALRNLPGVVTATPVFCNQEDLAPVGDEQLAVTMEV